METIGPSGAAFQPWFSVKLNSMLMSSADVFRTRQAIWDLTACLRHVGSGALYRLSSSDDVFVALSVFSERDNLCFEFPRDTAAYSDVLLAAAMPEEDFPAFVCSTTILLLDRLMGGESPDNLFWNWDAFQDHYRLADAPIRAATMNAYRIGEKLGVLSIDNGPSAADCLTRSKQEVLEIPNLSDPLARAIIAQDGTNDIAMKQDFSQTRSSIECKALRYLYERPQSIAPENPETAPLIAWTPHLELPR